MEILDKIFFSQIFTYIILIAVAVGIYYLGALSTKKENKVESIGSLEVYLNFIKSICSKIRINTGSACVGVGAVINGENLLGGMAILNYEIIVEQTDPNSDYIKQKKFVKVNAFSEEYEDFTAKLNALSLITVDVNSDYEMIPNWKEKLAERNSKSAVYIKLSKKILGENTPIGFLFIIYTNEVVNFNAEDTLEMCFSDIKKIEKLLGMTLKVKHGILLEE